MKNSVHLVCNSHLDPVWLWEWPEGLAEALAMARAAVAVCREFPAFIFNRNEVMYYEWIEEHDPALFREIRQLVRRGRWHVMGGWYLQPDCNMPSGESFVRQILVGRRYFAEKFGVEPTVAASLDAFGHTRGLAQILARSGYDAYLFCRPGAEDLPLPAGAFRWVGYDGSEVLARRAETHYNSPPGKARERVCGWLADNAHVACGLVLYGVGNHGGGPARIDAAELIKLGRERRDVDLFHSTPERYFEDARRREAPLPQHKGDLNPWAVGCYTSMMRVKRRHRKLENELYAVEKMATTAAMQGLVPYPRAELAEAQRDLLRSEFHDALPGSSIPPVEEHVVRMLDHGLEIVDRVKTRCFLALSGGQRPGQPDEFPILVYNPHPYRVTATVACEFQPAWPHQTGKFSQPQVYAGRAPLPSQAEQEHANINEDHRKRVVFRAELAPSCMNRFNCRVKMLPAKPPAKLQASGGRIRFKTAALEVVINTRTGLFERYRANGRDYVKSGAGRLLVVRDNADAWGTTVRSFRQVVGRFRLMTPAEAAWFAGVEGGKLAPVRVIEDGPVRSVVEVLLIHGHSCVCQRYKLPREGTEIEIETRVHWTEKDRILKLSVPTPFEQAAYRGQVAYGVADLPVGTDEAVAQKWVAVVSSAEDAALTCITDATYGSDMAGGEMRLSLLRAPAHSGFALKGRPIVKQDRFTPRHDQGEHVFHFWLSGGAVQERLTRVDREALAHHEQPQALSMFPSGEGRRPAAGVVLSDQVVQMTVFKQAEDGPDLIIRLFEPTGRARQTTVSLPSDGVQQKVQLGAFEIKTLRYRRRSKRLVEVDLMERPIKRK
ncbi:MAG: glycoside hydrolase family 38 C-terminal domain-containing protein [Phycisphaerae bacterium]|jgi:alpha-mannosidase